MRRLTTLALAAATTMALLPATATSANASAFSEQTICTTAPVPSGWIVISFQDWYQCGPKGSIYKNSKTIQDANGVPSGGTITGCTTGGNLPSWFWATDLSYREYCNPSQTPNGVLNNVQTMINLQGLPTGTTVTVCGWGTPPSGWAAVAVVSSYRCVLARGGAVGQNAMTIRKL